MVIFQAAGYKGLFLQVVDLEGFAGELRTHRHFVEDEEVGRLFHGRGGCFPGFENVSVDYFAPVILVTGYAPLEEGFLQSLVTEIIQEFGDRVKAILLQERHLHRSPTQLVWGRHEWGDSIIQELGLQYKVSLGQHQNVGFFLDTRNLRKYIKTHAKGRLCLNLFSYTGSLSVAAMAGGARGVVNMDLSRNSLATARHNHRLNQHDTSRVSFLPHDVLKSFGKLTKLGPFGLVILDPPSDQGKSFRVERDYGKIVRRLVDFVEPGGLVLACLNAPYLSYEDLRDYFDHNSPAGEFHHQEDIDVPPSFRESRRGGGLKVSVFKRSH